ncbi:MAG: NYN domain-containing protein [Archaeoglobus sp.]|nr:NYN domain-containing protein [Archaeoglobus sp.]
MSDPNDKVIIFIDGSNLFYACKRFSSGFKVDYEKLRNILADGRKLIRVYYYGLFNPFDGKVKERQMKFFHALQEMGFEVVYKPLRKRSDNMVEIALAVDLLSLGYKKAYDIAVLVTGDGDFVRAVEVIKSRGLRVEVAMFESATNPELRRKADKFISLDSLADKFEKK